MENKNKNTKVLFILIDGLSDLGIKNLLNQTILQFYKFPTFDKLAESGLNGVIDPVETGLACGSDTAHMSIFGYNPFKHYKGRGSFEAMGSGIPMDYTEIAFKSNFAYMDPKTKIVKLRRVDRDFDKWGLSLVDVINEIKVPNYEEYKITCKHATEHRVGIKISGPNLSGNITGTDPLKDNLLLRVPKANDNSENTIRSAKLLQALSDEIHQVLSKHSINLEREKISLPTANIVLLRGCGVRLQVDTFQNYHGMKGFFIAPTAIINGLGQTIGVDVPVVEGATGDYHSDHFAKGKKAVELLFKESYDFGFLHVKAVDDAGHDKSFDKKVKFCDRIDKVLSNIVEDTNKIIKENEELIFVLTGDHTTPLIVGDHTFEPVPITISTLSSLNQICGKAPVHPGLCEIRDNVKHFNEIESASGALGRFSGAGVMQLIKNMRKIVLENMQNMIILFKLESLFAFKKKLSA